MKPGIDEFFRGVNDEIINDRTFCPWTGDPATDWIWMQNFVKKQEMQLDVFLIKGFRDDLNTRKSREACWQKTFLILQIPSWVIHLKMRQCLQRETRDVSSFFACLIDSSCKKPYFKCINLCSLREKDWDEVWCRMKRNASWVQMSFVCIGIQMFLMLFLCDTRSLMYEVR